VGRGGGARWPGCAPGLTCLDLSVELLDPRAPAVAVGSALQAVVDDRQLRHRLALLRLGRHDRLEELTRLVVRAS